MKIQNQLVSIKNGNKEINFTNLILNSYLNLFRDSCLNFKDKDLKYCLINFNKTNNITIDSIEMNFNLVLEANFQDMLENISSSVIINKYYYKDEFLGEEARWKDFEGQAIKELGFATRNEETGKYTLYAYLNVSEYNIIVQKSQPIVISRIDKIQSDMETWSPSKEIKGPYHLSMRGLLEYSGLTYVQTIPKLYSIGFGNSPEVMEKEFLAKDLTFIKNKNKIDIQESFKVLYNNKPFLNYLIYKFKLYKIVYNGLEIQEIDTGMYYHQFLKLKKHGELKLSIEYGRS